MAAVLPVAARAAAGVASVKVIGKKAQNVSVELLGYDFIGLAVKILVFQLVALVIAKYIEFVNGANGVLKALVSVLGFTIPSFLPAEINQFYTTGYMGIKYWDVVKLATIGIIIWELINYTNAQKALGGEPSAATIGVFALLLGFFILITVPELFNRVKQASSHITLTPASGMVGSNFIVEVKDLLPFQPFKYGWKNSDSEIIFEKTYNSDFDGHFSFEELVLSSTAPGTYTIYFDQRPTGPLYEATFTVLQGISI